MPKRIQFSKHGDSEVLEIVEYKNRNLDSMEVRVKNYAIGVNFIDVYYRTGIYPSSELPSGIGTEGAGVIDCIGREVTKFKPGDRVAYATGSLGAYSEFYILPESSVVKLPNDISYEDAAMVLLKGLTVQYLLSQIYIPIKNEIILFHAAAGGVGSIACQWAKAMGVRLIGTVSSSEKMDIAKKMGAWKVINYTYENVSKRVLDLTDGKKCAVVYDGVGRATWLTSLNCLSPKGLLISFGNASGPVTDVNLGILSQKGSLYVTRPTLSSYANTSETLQSMANEVFNMVRTKKISTSISRFYPLKEAAKAQKELETRKTTGSSILIP